MKSTFSYFSSSFIVAGIGLLLAFGLGFNEGGMSIAIAAVISALTLSVLETSVSLDNAVVNAKYLEKMNDRSKNWFMTWGMLIAVFGMRIIFPILIVCLAAWTDPWTALKMALFDPLEYQHHIEAAHIAVMSFGAAFLLMVALEFFFDHEKDDHWIPGLEHFAAFVGKYPNVQLLIGAPLVLAASYFAPTESQTVLFAGFGGMLSFYVIHGLKEMLEAAEDSAMATAGAAALAQGNKLMIGSLVFLEVLDASFSFDGVIAAFAITNKFLIIAIGLGVGAMFVRSMTIYLVEKKTMSKLKYLEHGAFFGIVWLVIAMAASIFGIHLGEVAVAGGAALLIAVSLVHSILVKDEVAA